MKMSMNGMDETRRGQVGGRCSQSSACLPRSLLLC